MEIPLRTVSPQPGSAQAVSLATAKSGVVFLYLDQEAALAADVLDMEVEDLQLLAVGQPGGRGVPLLLYDPMPGGSGGPAFFPAGL